MKSVLVYTIYSLFIGVFVWYLGYWYIALPLVFMAGFTLYGAIISIIKTKRGGNDK